MDQILHRDVIVGHFVNLSYFAKHTPYTSQNVLVYVSACVWDNENDLHDNGNSLVKQNQWCMSCKKLKISRWTEKKEINAWNQSVVGSVPHSSVGCHPNWGPETFFFPLRSLTCFCLPKRDNRVPFDRTFRSEMRENRRLLWLFFFSIRTVVFALYTARVHRMFSCPESWK